MIVKNLKQIRKKKLYLKIFACQYIFIVDCPSEAMIMGEIWGGCINRELQSISTNPLPKLLIKDKDTLIVTDLSCRTIYTSELLMTNIHDNLQFEIKTKDPV